MTTAIKALFAFALGMAILCQATLASRIGRLGEGTPGIRKCCVVYGHGCPLKCRSLACCDPGNSPVSVPGLANASTDDCMMAAPAPTLLSVAVAILPNARGSVFSPVPAVGVPLYRRNCAYLL